MPVKVIHYRHQGRELWGVLRPEGIVEIPGTYATTGDLLRDGAERAREIAARVGAAGAALAERDVELLCPITRNQQLVCQAINYRDHMLESGIDPVVVGLAIGLLAYAYPPERSALERVTGRYREFREQPTPELAHSVREGLRRRSRPTSACSASGTRGRAT